MPSCRKVGHTPVYKRNPATESRELQQCFRFLTLTSRSFATVIQELNPELLVPITLYYLILRGLDTIEDDMTIPLETKTPLLRNFHNLVEVDGWQFHESKEKDRALLENFDVVIIELKKLKPTYRAIIVETAKKMGCGMADYARNDEMLQNGIQSNQEYERYCHYVAGLVGEGLTRLFVLSGLASPTLSDQPSLTESMAQFLQKTNIIRDVREDWDEGRFWYPKQIWSQHVDQWPDLFDVAKQDKSLSCVAHMVLDALKHVEECLSYMAEIRDQGCFNFVAIPQTMAIATLELVFRNPEVLRRTVKISKGDACSIMLQTTENIFAVCAIFRRYIRRIREKNDPCDPNFTVLDARCAEIDQFIESLYLRQDLETFADKRVGQPTTDFWKGVTGLTIMTCTFLVIAVIFVWGFGGRGHGYNEL